jgi:catechol 2,3-dioxygenase-like lactoylglutathione lyase family enzyme
MIGYVMLGTNDLVPAARFYDALLGELGAKRFMDTEQFIVWAVDPAQTSLGITLPENGIPASSGNGTMVALAGGTPAKVDALHKKALSLGATDEGAPAARGPGFYAGYFRDLDGNKLNVFCMT